MLLFTVFRTNLLKSAMAELSPKPPEEVQAQIAAFVSKSVKHFEDLRHIFNRIFTLALGRVLDSAEANRLDLDGSDVANMSETYREWRMDGAGSEEGRYRKTPLAGLKALGGKTGIQALELPRANVVYATNPWRSFIDVTPDMSEVVIMESNQHFNAVKAV